MQVALRLTLTDSVILPHAFGVAITYCPRVITFFVRCQTQTLGLSDMLQQLF